MRMVRVSTENGADLAAACEVTEGYLERLVGLMGRPGLARGQGLWIEPCNSVHTFFMRFPIDVVYVDRDRRVIDVCRAVGPWRAHLPRAGAHAVLELPAGAAAPLKEGDRLCIS